MSGRRVLVARLAPGLVRIEHTDYRGRRDLAMWARCRLRKPNQCAVTGEPLAVGSLAYRPVGNQDYRMERIAATVVDSFPLDEPAR